MSEDNARVAFPITPAREVWIAAIGAPNGPEEIPLYGPYLAVGMVGGRQEFVNSNQEDDWNVVMLTGMDWAEWQACDVYLSEDAAENAIRRCGRKPVRYAR